MRRYSAHVESAYEDLKGMVGTQGKTVTKSELEKIYFLLDNLSPEEIAVVMEDIELRKTTLTKVYKHELAKKNNKEVKTNKSQAGLLLKKLTKANKALYKQLESYDGEMHVLYKEADILSAFVDSIVSLFWRYEEILSALGDPQITRKLELELEEELE